MKKAKSIMLQGTSSDVGKSVLCTALCRIFQEDGYKVAPFKAQNMALNSYVTVDGLEIGRAQGAQAEAAKVDATVEMSPILLKPKQDMESQVIVLGKPYKDLSAKDYRRSFLPQALELVKGALESLQDKYEVLVIEGAGSPAEVNLKDKEIVNMKTAELADAPVLLVADIDRGGVFASIVGTLELLTPSERERVKGFLINKFRGDIDLLKPGLDFLEKKTGKPVVGVIPYVFDHGVDQEDSVTLSKDIVTQGNLEIAIIQLPRISNFTDMNSLFKIPDTKVRYVKKGQPLGKPDIVVIPGTKNSILDLEYLKEEGYFNEIKDLAAQGVSIVGICGGYQMLGKYLHDPEGTEAGIGTVEGLGLLDIETTFYAEKNTYRVEAVLKGQQGFMKNIPGSVLKGYEIHTGVTKLGAKTEPLLEIIKRSDQKVKIYDGAVSSNAKIFGTHLHGLFDNKLFVLEWINSIRCEKNLTPLKEEELAIQDKDEIYSNLAKNVKLYLNMELIYEMMGLK